MNGRRDHDADDGFGDDGFGADGCGADGFGADGFGAEKLSEELVFEGRKFPGEDEWLDLDLPTDAPAVVQALLSPGAPDAEAPEAADQGVGSFVERTLAALRDPTPEQLASFAVPDPSDDFVARTAGAVQQDRRARWRENLARYVAPEPSPAFVERTLRALAADHEGTEGALRGRSPGQQAVPPLATRAAALRRWALPVLAAAAVLIVAFGLPREHAQTIELRAHSIVPSTLAPSWSSSPLPGVLIAIDAKADSGALPRSGPDGIHLLLLEEVR